MLPLSVKRGCAERHSHFPGPPRPRQGEAGETGHQGSELINQLQMRPLGLVPPRQVVSCPCPAGPGGGQGATRAPTREGGPPSGVARGWPGSSRRRETTWMAALSHDTALRFAQKRRIGMPSVLKRGKVAGALLPMASRLGWRAIFPGSLRETQQPLGPSSPKAM